jgi:hypothetical protein
MARLLTLVEFSRFWVMQFLNLITSMMPKGQNKSAPTQTHLLHEFFPSKKKQSQQTSWWLISEALLIVKFDLP